MSRPDTDTWNPSQYHRFQAERSAPFHDLLALVAAVPGGEVIDLGCGTGELSAILHRATEAANTVGIDSSPAMLAETVAYADPTAGLRFELADIDDIDRSVDVLFANASLQWVPDHPALFARLAAHLRPRGQLAVQVPANHDHPSHTVASEVGRQFGLEPTARTSAVLLPEAYAALLDGLGFVEQHVRLQVYGHHLPATADVIEWVKGTRLTEVASRLDPATYEEFLVAYRARLLETLGDPSGQQPYFYAFKRILMWARLG